ncbi:MAG: hypothetical protein ACLTJG_03315 [[Clostridium] innocuum]
MYLFFQNEYHINQFAEGRKFVINVKDDSLEGDWYAYSKGYRGIWYPIGMNGYEISAPACKEIL